jgi:hypothetical protein
VAAIDELAGLETVILAAEGQVNALIYAAYDLARDEIHMIEEDRAPVFAAV